MTSQRATSTLYAQILASSTILQSKKLQLFGEMANPRSEKVNIQDDVEHLSVLETKEMYTHAHIHTGGDKSERNMGSQLSRL